MAENHGKLEQFQIPSYEGPLSVEDEKEPIDIIQPITSENSVKTSSSQQQFKEKLGTQPDQPHEVIVLIGNGIARARQAHLESN